MGGRLLLVAGVVAGAAAWGGPGEAGEKVELDPQVTYAPSWEAAVEEAKLLNVPIVVHSHGFYCGPCWGLHGAILKNKKYIEFAEKNTVEVICLGSLQEGIDKQDERAATYETEVGGKPVKCLVEFPGMTVEQMQALNASKGGSYNKTGKIPYTCIVDPHTLEELQHWQGGSVSAGSLSEAVTEVRKKLTEAHGKGLARKDLKLLATGEERIAALVEKGDFATAVAEATRVEGKAKDWPEAMWKRLAAARATISEAAVKAVDAIADQARQDQTGARKTLAALAPRLKGTGQEERVKGLLSAWAPAAPK